MQLMICVPCILNLSLPKLSCPCSVPMKVLVPSPCSGKANRVPSACRTRPGCLVSGVGRPLPLSLHPSLPPALYVSLSLTWSLKSCSVSTMLNVSKIRSMYMAQRYRLPDHLQELQVNKETWWEKGRLYLPRRKSNEQMN